MSSLLDYYFNTEYELSLSAWGDGTLAESELLDFQKPDAIISEYKKKHRRYPRSISLLMKDSRGFGSETGYTGVDTAFFEKLETLKELILPDTITYIDLTPRLEKIFKDNDTLIRGSFDSFAESFAKKNGLHFRPADFIFADFEDTRWRESTTMKLIFKRNGNVEIKETSSSPGSNAGNTFGGSFTHSLHRDFFRIQTVEQIAERFSIDARTAIIKDGRLKAFIEKAKTHDYYRDKN
jgi:hypothetical protein